ncbi:MAG: penicillin-binding protein 1C [Janthinobacterium lividum]
MRSKFYLFMYRLISFKLKVVLFCIIIGIGFFSLDKIYPLSLDRFYDVSITITSSDTTCAHVFQTKDDKWRLPVTANDVDARFIKALIYCEDQHFGYHFGINPFSLLRAFGQFASQGRIVSGGSTLTMQVARLLEPRPRNMSSKVIEIYRALQLEAHFSKQEILNIYLTLAPYGGNIEGIQAASYSYFGKSAKNLNPEEIALLIALPQSPRRSFHKVFTPYALKARNTLLNRLFNASFMEMTVLQSALQQKLPLRKNLPRHLPHLSQRLRQHNPDLKTITTSINLPLQIYLQNLVTQSLNILPSKVNVAVLVVHHATQEVIVYLGSSDFFNHQNQGQIDFTRAIRSPGSTLKPFIYGMGFETGLFQPNTLVNDEVHAYGSYRPGNFDKTFNGSVTIEEALIQSLNIPAVSALNRLGALKFLGMLEEVNIKPKFPDAYTAPGLSLALGGVGMSLEQLMILYSALAQGGIISPLKYQPSVSNCEVRLFSNQTCGWLTEILQKNSLSFDPSCSNIAFKTGTSYGYRDAWVFGYNHDYVVGIWIGRPDGASCGYGTGASLAVPLMQQIFQVLPKHSNNQKITNDVNYFTLKKTQKYAHFNEHNNHQPLRLLFPVHNTKIDFFSSDNQIKKISLQAAGGRRPYTWLINQQPIATKSWRSYLIWHPLEKGFYKITLLDSQGQSASASITID